MEYEGIKSLVKSEFENPDSERTDFEIETKDEFWTLIHDAKTEEETTVDTSVVVSPGNHPAHSSKERLQLCKVHLPLLCRLCAVPHDDMVVIFNPDKTDRSIIEKIERCLPIVVKLTDTLSKYICRSCLANLELCYKFHKTVVKAHEHLLALERQIKIEENRPLFPLCDDNIEGLKESSDAKTSSSKQKTAPKKKRTADAVLTKTVKVKLTDFKLYPAVFNSTKTVGKNNVITKSMRSSRDANSSIAASDYDSGQTSASIIDQRRICDSEVPGESPSRISGPQSGSPVKQQARPTIHEQVENEGPPFKCDFCPKAFKTKAHRLCHIKLHIGYGPYRCSYCDKRFATEDRRDTHLRVHTGEQPFKCDACDMRFAWHDGLKQHLRRCYTRF